MAAPRRPVSYLAFDYGTRRVGVATGNTLLGRAQPLTTVQAQGDARFAAIAKLIAEWRPEALVVGVPFHPDGAAHDNTRRARAFGRQLQGRFRLPVHEVDERYSTTEALAQGAADADAAAAAIILDQFLRARERHEPNDLATDPKVDPTADRTSDDSTPAPDPMPHRAKARDDDAAA